MTKVARAFSAAPVGFDGHIIEVESNTTKGLSSLQIVGLGNKTIDEAKERVKSALVNSLLEYPAKRITINLTPAELPKDDTTTTCPSALAILTSSDQLQQAEVADVMFAGELALTGELRPIKSAVTVAETARNMEYNKRFYLPEVNVTQASLVSVIEIIGVPSLKTLFLYLNQEATLPSHSPAPVILNATHHHTYAR